LTTPEFGPFPFKARARLLRPWRKRTMSADPRKIIYVGRVLILEKPPRRDGAETSNSSSVHDQSLQLDPIRFSFSPSITTRAYATISARPPLLPSSATMAASTRSPAFSIDEFSALVSTTLDAATAVDISLNPRQSVAQAASDARPRKKTRSRPNLQKLVISSRHDGREHRVPQTAPVSPSFLMPQRSPTADPPSATSMFASMRKFSFASIVGKSSSPLEEPTIGFPPLPDIVS
jgi:hypothetical protein